MRLLILVNNCIGHNLTNADTSVEKVIQEFSDYSQLDVDVVLFSKESSGIPHVTELIYPADLAYAFAFVPRQWLLEILCCHP